MTVTVKTFDEFQKNSIVGIYGEKKYTVKAIAKMFSTSTRTIGRVLEERGLAQPVARLKGEAYTVMKALKEADIPAGLAVVMIGILKSEGVRGVVELQQKLKPAITPHTIQDYLNNCSKEQLAKHFYASGLVKIAEITKAHADRKQQIAALFKQSGAQSPLFATAPPL